MEIFSNIIHAASISGFFLKLWMIICSVWALLTAGSMLTGIAPSELLRASFDFLGVADWSRYPDGFFDWWRDPDRMLLTDSILFEVVTVVLIFFGQKSASQYGAISAWFVIFLETEVQQSAFFAWMVTISLLVLATIGLVANKLEGFGLRLSVYLFTLILIPISAYNALSCGILRVKNRTND